MMFLLFTILDLFTAIIILLLQWNVIGGTVPLYNASYLIVKGAWYWKDFMSWIDIIVGIWILALMFGASGWFSYFAAIYLLYKVVVYIYINV